MDDSYLAHHGVKGMKWGVRKQPVSTGRTSSMLPGARFKSNVGNKQTEPSQTSKSSAKPKVHEMDDAQLAKALQRVRMEQEYSRLTAVDNHPYLTRGKKAAEDALFNGLQQGGTEIVKGMVSKVPKILAESNSPAAAVKNAAKEGVKEGTKAAAKGATESARQSRSEKRAQKKRQKKEKPLTPEFIRKNESQGPSSAHQQKPGTAESKHTASHQTGENPLQISRVPFSQQRPNKKKRGRD